MDTVFCVSCASQDHIIGLMCKKCRDEQDLEPNRRTSMKAHHISVSYCYCCGQPSQTIKCVACKLREFQSLQT